ncbi:hypothetical protein VTL71DRAFT_4889 [Oculimacula yallundae]|uniref:Uncharacterized protein n=1 Tax=Oculimacula yallundae TaxID=86028 RepID=A0ABR4C386_9HELO
MSYLEPIRSPLSINRSILSNMPYPSYISYDEKAAYERRYRSSNNIHGRQSSTSSTSSTLSNTSSSSSTSYRYESDLPPRYSYNYFTAASPKPLPALPASRSSRKQSEGERKVSFATQKPLPPLPLRFGQVDERENGSSQSRSRSGSGASAKSAGECAWWTKEYEGKPF